MHGMGGEIRERREGVTATRVQQWGRTREECCPGRRGSGSRSWGHYDNMGTAVGRGQVKRCPGAGGR